MLNRNLAVIAPQIGAISETFIQRHMTDLAPKQTVVLVGTKLANKSENWTVENPILCFEDLQTQVIKRSINFLGRKLGINPFSKQYFAKEFLKAHKVGVILSEYLDLSLEWIELAEQLKIPLFAHAHGYDVSTRLLDENWTRKYLLLNKIAGIITINQISKKRLIELGITPSKIHIIPYGVAIPDLSLDKQNHTEIRCLAVGRIIPKKAPILLLDSFRRAVEQIPELRLDFVGEGELLPAARDFVKTFNLENKVMFHGAKSNQFVKELMSVSDIFLQHSVVAFDTGDEEGLPVAILEAMAHTLPVVSTIHAGIPDEVIDGETGYLVNEGDTKKMALQIIKLAQDSQLRKQFSLAAWKRAKEHFGWDKEKEALQNLMNISQ